VANIAATEAKIRRAAMLRHLVVASRSGGATMECRFEAGCTEAMWNVVPIAPPVFLLFSGAGKIAVPAHPHWGKSGNVVRRNFVLISSTRCWALRLLQSGMHRRADATSASATKFIARDFER
jgi:hypothetical protein